MTTQSIFDVAVIGAGLSGLTCARQLQEQGYKVIILEKSRGLGGRLATRRIDKTCVDHGLSYFFEQGNHSQNLIKQLTDNNIIDSLIPKIYQLTTTLEDSNNPTQSYYYASQGMTAIAKYLAEPLTIWRQYRVINLTLTQEKLWYLTCETPPNEPNTLLAKSIVSTIPAPQLTLLLNSSHLTHLPPSFMETLTQVTYHPCLTVMAGFNEVGSRKSEVGSNVEWRNFDSSDLIWDQVRILSHPNLAWIGLESIKRDTSNESIFVFHSTPNYAAKFLEQSDLKPVGQQLLNEAEKLLSLPFNKPNWYQVHRWRYARPNQSLPLSCLSTVHPLPLVACGDWCEGKINSKSSWYLEKAIASGLAAANQIKESVKTLSDFQ